MGNPLFDDAQAPAPGAAMSGPPTPGDNTRLLNEYNARLDEMEAEAARIKEDMASIYKEAKTRGFNLKALRKQRQIRNMNSDDRRALQDYCESTGLFD